MLNKILTAHFRKNIIIMLGFIVAVLLNLSMSTNAEAANLCLENKNVQCKRYVFQIGEKTMVIQSMVMDSVLFRPWNDPDIEEFVPLADSGGLGFDPNVWGSLVDAFWQTLEDAKNNVISKVQAAVNAITPGGGGASDSDPTDCCGGGSCVNHKCKGGSRPGHDCSCGPDPNP